MGSIAMEQKKHVSQEIDNFESLLKRKSNISCPENIEINN